MEQIKMIVNSDTIVAISSPQGVAGIAVIRVSGPDALKIVNSAWKGANLLEAAPHTVHFGKYFTVEGELLDEALATIFKRPRSFTGEDVVELGVHGSSWIQREILKDIIKRGGRIANPGEFTQRAFLNGKLDLAQAEGVADLIASSSKAAHDMAISQTKGAFSKEFNLLRDKLVEFASLLELELDFSEEDVEFADRKKLLELLEGILGKINRLASSYSRGAVLKEGVPVVIAGIPNAGKSSLLNLLLEDDKAIVTDIPGTTRDTIEDTVEIDGILYRFIDTAGLRETTDVVEGLGVERAHAALSKAFVVIWMFDSTQEMSSQIKGMKEFIQKNPGKPIIPIINKSDLTSNLSASDETDLLTEGDIFNKEFTSYTSKIIPFSTTTHQGLAELLHRLNSLVKQDTNPSSDILVSNARHYEALIHASSALTRAKEALTSNIGCDLIAQDIREAISYLSIITGSITTDDLLHSIFSRFCIGK